MLASVDIVDGVEPLALGVVPGADCAMVLDGVVAGAVDWGVEPTPEAGCEPPASPEAGLPAATGGVPEPLPPELAVPELCA